MFHDFINLLFPKICSACDIELLPNEKIICTKCLHDLPVTQNHLEENNDTEKIFHGRVNIQNATSLLLFEKKGLVQKLVHDLKYKGREEIGEFLGAWLGNELKLHPKYQKITAVVPVPLHKEKLKKRGYNQVDKFGIEIAKALEIPYINNVLVKRSASRTQTFKSRFARWGSIDETFLIENPLILENHHVLIVDDLVTTGATLEACATKLLNIPGTKVSIATMAITR